LRRGRPAGPSSPDENEPQPGPAQPEPAPKAAPAPAQEPAPEPAPAGSEQPAAEAVGDTQITRIREAWPAILDRLAGSSRVAWTAFHAATPVSCTGGALAVAVSEPGNARAIAQRGHDERLRQAIIDVVALDLTIDVLHDPEPSSPGGSSPQASGRGVGPGPAGSSRTAPAAPGAAPPAAGSPAVQETGPGRSSRPADVVRAAGSTTSDEHVVDEPSPDDPDLDAGAADGLALITRELGARPIGEIDHT
jgi:DNA polymerase-3 subunit gamma/tau